MKNERAKGSRKTAAAQREPVDVVLKRLGACADRRRKFKQFGTNYTEAWRAAQEWDLRFLAERLVDYIPTSTLAALKFTRIHNQSYPGGAQAGWAVVHASCATNLREVLTVRVIVAALKARSARRKAVRS